VVFDTTAPEGSISINAGARFATSQTCTLAYTAQDQGAGVSSLRLGNSPLSNLVFNSSYTALEGGWEFSPGGQDNPELSMAELAVDPDQAESIWQPIPADTFQPYFGDTLRLSADVIVRAPGSESTGLGTLGLVYRFTNENPEHGDSQWTVAQVEFEGGLVAHVGMSSLETALLLPEPGSGEGWTFAGADVKVKVENGSNQQARVWLDNVRLEPSGPAPDFSWWQACDTAGNKAWDLGAGDGEKTVWLSLQDSAGVERAEPLSDGIILDATLPAADISTPDEGTYVNGMVEITGLAYDSIAVDSDSLFEWYRLYYRHADSSGWQPVDPDSVSYTAALPDTANPGNYANVLGHWNTEGLADGEYYLTLTVQDSAGNSASDETWCVLDNEGGSEGMCAGPAGGGSGMGEGSIYVGSQAGYVVRYSEELDSLESLTVNDSSGPAYVSALLRLNDDSLLVLDARNRAIQKLGTNGQNRRRLVSNLTIPAALARDANGNVWLVDKGSGRVAKFRPQGTLVFARTKGEGDTLDFDQPQAIAITDSGPSVYIADMRNNRIVVWDSSGHYERSLTGVSRPSALACGSGNGMYVVDSAGRITGLNSHGGRFLTITSPDSSPLKSLLLSAYGRHVFTLKPQGNEVLKYRIKSDDTIPSGQQAAGRLQLPTSFILYQPCPNPTRANMSIRYGIPKRTNVSIKLFDICGKLASTLVNTEQKPGYYNVTWNGQDKGGRSLPAGVYFIRLAGGSMTFERKVVLLR